MTRVRGAKSAPKEGEIIFKVGQIRWDGRGQAIVQGYSQYHFDDRSEGDYGWGAGQGWWYRLRKLHGRWRVLGRNGNFAAG